MRNDFQAVVVCGRNEKLKSQIEGLVAFHRDRYRVLGYTNDMSDLIRTATLFVGKPGGLSSSECMAAGLPMVLIHPIPGQEVRNSDFLLEEGAAVALQLRNDCRLQDRSAAGQARSDHTHGRTRSDDRKTRGWPDDHVRGAGFMRRRRCG